MMTSYVEVALGRRAWADQVRLVGIRHERGVAIDLAVDAYRADPELAQRAEHADRDLAAVGYQYFVEHADDVSRSGSEGDGPAIAARQLTPGSARRHAARFSRMPAWRQAGIRAGSGAAAAPSAASTQAIERRGGLRVR